MERRKGLLRNRSGASLAIVAVSLIGMLAMMALAIDVGMMYSARNEAQRVADSAALAGVSEFFNAPASQPEAHRRAMEFVKANTIMGVPVDTMEATVLVDMAQERVRVVIHRQQLSTWFARIFGISQVGVRAAATAELSQDNAAGAQCVRPWAIQDLWHLPDPVTGERLPVDTDLYNPANGDRYLPVPAQNPASDPNATGYGSHHPLHPWTNGSPDYGRPLVLKANHPSQGNNPNVAQPGPGEFMIWQMPDDPGMEQCAMNGTNNNAAYANAICGCNRSVIQLGQPYPLDYGNRVGPTDHGMTGQGQLPGLLGKDPGAYWDASTNTVVGSSFANWQQSPRVVKIALMAPLPPPPGGGNYTAANLTHVTFTNVATMFVEGYDQSGPGQPRVIARFLYYANAANVAGPGGPLLRRIRLIE